MKGVFFMNPVYVVAIYDDGQVLGVFDTWVKAEMAVSKRLKKFYRSCPDNKELTFKSYKDDLWHLKTYGSVIHFAHLETAVLNKTY